MLWSQFDTNLAPIPWGEWKIITIIWVLHNTQFFFSLSTIWITFCSAFLAVDLYSEPIGYVRNITLKHKSFFLSKLAEHYQLHLMLFSLIISLNSRQLSAIHQNFVNVKNILKSVQMKRLNQYSPNVHIFMFHSFGLVAAQTELLY